MPERVAVSVIMAVRDGASHVLEAAQSVLGQGPGVELIVVDDGSTDDTPDVIRSLGQAVRYTRQSCQGPAAARNTGIALACGELIGFVDADDRWETGRLESQLPVLARRPDVGILMGLLAMMRPAGGAAYRESLYRPFPSWSLGAALIRRQVLDEVGPLDPSLRYGEDVDWFMRARERGVVIDAHEQIVLRVRLHAANMTRDKAQRDAGLARALRMSLARRRHLGMEGDLP